MNEMNGRTLVIMSRKHSSNFLYSPKLCKYSFESGSFSVDAGVKLSSNVV